MARRLWTTKRRMGECWLIWRKEKAIFPHESWSSRIIITESSAFALCFELFRFFPIRNQLHHLMLPSPVDFALVLFVWCVISAQINAENHTNLTGSWGHVCSSDASCSSPLICSNASQCVCPPPSFALWNGQGTTCLSCPSGWIPWTNGQCLLVIISEHSVESYDRAINACSIQAAQLLQIHNKDDFRRLQRLLNLLAEDSDIAHLVTEGVWVEAIDGKLKIHGWYWSSDEMQIVTRRMPIIGVIRGMIALLRENDGHRQSERGPPVWRICYARRNYPTCARVSDLSSVASWTHCCVHPTG